MTRERAAELLKLGRYKADYIRFMTCAELDEVNSLGYPHHNVLLKLRRG